MAANIDWHTLTAADIATRMQAKLEGLSSADAARRLRHSGPNRLKEAKKASPITLFFKQFSDFMILVLLGAAFVSGLLGETADTLAVLAIVVINAVLGFFQEFRAEKALEALQQLSAPTCRVIRDGRTLSLDAQGVVPGDAIILESGDRIPADARLIEAHALACEEAALTGESMPSDKDATWRGSATLPLGDRKNMVYMGTMVTRGRAKAIVIATGMETEIGHIATLIQSSESGPTPLQRRLEELGRWLVLFCLGIVAIVFAAGVAQGFPVYKMFLTGVSLAVAAIPEGLPAVVTVALALGVQRMIRRNAIVRKLPAVETLGCATVICSDKTGTLTQNAMTVKRIWLAKAPIDVEGTGYRPEGEFRVGGKTVRPDQMPDLEMALRIAAGCNHAELQQQTRAHWAGRLAAKLRGSAAWTTLGDPTEIALLVAAAKGGVWRDAVEVQNPTVGEIPFDSDRKRMTVLVKAGSGRLLSLTKGAPDLLLDRCTYILDGGRPRLMTPTDRRHILAAANEMAGAALRVLGLAFKGPDVGTTSNDPKRLEATWENGMTFAGMMGMMDPPRPEVAQAIRVARRAGIRTLMVTGDHPNTALAVAQELGLATDASQLVTGAALDRMDEKRLNQVVRQATVFARVSPSHKTRIVKALRSQGEVVAMTGDGVNDAPALKESDIGVAMGRSGTDVTKEAAAMILTDDNYASIVAAVEEGRGIYDNIRKFIRYLLACNAGEVLLMFTATVVGLPLPLLPLQILWMNLVTDGLPAVALGVDPTSPDVMHRPPRQASASVFSGGLHKEILIRGILLGGSSLAAFAVALASGQGLEYARTVGFTAIVVAQMLYVFECRKNLESHSIPNPLSNPALLVATCCSMAMQLGVVYWPPAQALFHTVALSPVDWAMIAFFSGGTVVLHSIVRFALQGAERRIGWVRA